MKDIEDVLKSERSEWDKIEAPADLENRLRSSLDNITLILMFSYSYDTLAYYGMKIMGYETIVHGSIQELYEEGAGQEIYRSYESGSGVEVTLDGIMYDENELVAFIKVESSHLKVDEITLLMEINGLRPIRYPAQGGRGLEIDDTTQVWVHSFEAPAFYEKWLSLNLNIITPGGSEQGSIDFTLDRRKAMKRMVRQYISAVPVELENLKIDFHSLTASRLSTTIEGVITTQAAADTRAIGDSYERPSLRFDVYVDDNLYDTAYVGLSPAGEKDFSAEIMGLPADFQSIDFRNFRLVRMEIIDRAVEIGEDTRNLSLHEDLIITRVFGEGGHTIVGVRSRGIPIMGLFSGDKQLQAVEGSSYSNLPEEPQAVERLYRFEGWGEELTLRFKAINYLKYTKDTTIIDVVQV